MALNTARRNQIKQIFEQFIRNRARTIRRLKIEDLNINPSLIRILAKEMDLNDAKYIVRWLVSQRLERGTVTSFGIALQDAAKVFSEGTGVEGADILKTKQGRHHHIQVKSGPNTIPKDLGVRISQLLRSAQRRNKDQFVSLECVMVPTSKSPDSSAVCLWHLLSLGRILWISSKHRHQEETCHESAFVRNTLAFGNRCNQFPLQRV